MRLVEGYLDGFHHPAQRQADLLQPAGKAPHGQVERRQHQHQHARRQKRLLVAANGLPVELQGLILALAEQRAGRPDKKAGKGVLKHAVHHHLQQEQARQPGDEGGIIQKECPIYACKVMRVCPKCDKPTRPAHKLLADGKKVRVCKKCGAEI